SSDVCSSDLRPPPQGDPIAIRQNNKIGSIEIARNGRIIQKTSPIHTLRKLVSSDKAVNVRQKVTVVLAITSPRPPANENQMRIFIEFSQRLNKRIGPLALIKKAKVGQQTATGRDAQLCAQPSNLVRRSSMNSDVATNRDAAQLL